MVVVDAETRGLALNIETGDLNTGLLLEMKGVLN